MFELMLMRHAKSDWNNNLSDIDRPLNDRGASDAFRMGDYLNRNNLVPGRMLVSPAQRTQETARLLLDNLRLSEDNIIVDPALYLAGRSALCEVIERYAIDNQSLLVLAHNPGLDDLVSYLASTAPPLSTNGKLMATCTVACFRLDSPEALKLPGQGELQTLLRAKEIVDTR